MGEAKHLDVVPQKTAMIKAIVASTWGAVTQPSPDDIDSKGFEADAVIANPPVFGHIHVCEALGIPLHIMFPQPWYYGSRDFPHPMMGMSYDGKTSAESNKNFGSYATFEAIAFSGMSFYINRWRRTTLDVPVVYLGSGASTLIPASRVPFSAMWSPSFVPKPDDWPEQCRVVGTFTKTTAMRGRASLVSIDTTPFADLVEFLFAGPKPIFVGFGSMVVEDTSQLAAIIMKAADAADCRVVVQSSWSKLDVGASARCHGVGPCPHDWLLPQCCAVVHHGGAGTTAAGLRYGLPTLVCPFFGDQFLWAEMVRRAGVGPAPCSVWKLTETVLAEKFAELQKPEIQEAARKLSMKMKREDGIQGGLDHFLSDLPRDNMLCDVSLLLGETRLAKYESQKYGVKLSVEMVAIAKSLGFQQPVGDMRSMDYFKAWWNNVSSLLVTRNRFQLRRHHVTRYSLGRVQTLPQGMLAGITGFLRHLGLMLIQPLYRPDSWARSHGLVGCMAGAIVSPFCMLLEIFRALVVLLDRIVTGICNGCCQKSYLYTLDSRRDERIHEKGYTKAQVDELTARGFSKETQRRATQAFEHAAIAKRIFHNAQPFYPEGQWHFQVADALKLASAFEQGNDKLGLSNEELKVLTASLREQGEKGASSLSFSKTLLLLRKAIEKSGRRRQIGASGRQAVFETPTGVEIWNTLFDTLDVVQGKV